MLNLRVAAFAVGVGLLLVAVTGLLGVGWGALGIAMMVVSVGKQEE